MFSPANLLRAVVPAIIIAIVVVVVGLLPLIDAAETPVDDTLYTTDLSAGAVPYVEVKPGRSVCVAGVELESEAKLVRVFFQTNTRTRVRLVTTFKDDRGVVGTSRIDELSDPNAGVPRDEPIDRTRTSDGARVCTVNRGRRAVAVGIGQASSVGFMADPPRPLLRVDVLAGGGVDRIDRVDDALSSATLFKSRVVSTPLFIVGAVLMLAVVVALAVAILRPSADRESRS